MKLDDIRNLAYCYKEISGTYNHPIVNIKQSGNVMFKKALKFYFLLKDSSSTITTNNLEKIYNQLAEELPVVDLRVTEDIYFRKINDFKHLELLYFLRYCKVKQWNYLLLDKKKKGWYSIIGVSKDESRNKRERCVSIDEVDVMRDNILADLFLKKATIKIRRTQNSGELVLVTKYAKLPISLFNFIMRRFRAFKLKHNVLILHKVSYEDLCTVLKELDDWGFKIQ